MSIDALPDVEREALHLLLSGDDLSSQTLRAQLSYVAKIERTETGAGVYVVFELGDDAPPLENRANLQIADVFAVSKRCDEIGFLLFVKEGLIDCLEAYVHADSYPSYTDCDFKLEKAKG